MARPFSFHPIVNDLYQPLLFSFLNWTFFLANNFGCAKSMSIHESNPINFVTFNQPSPQNKTLG